MEEGENHPKQVGQHDAERCGNHDLDEHRGGPQDIPLEEEEHAGECTKRKHHGLYRDPVCSGLVHGGDSTDKKAFAEGVDRSSDRRPVLLEGCDQG